MKTLLASDIKLRARYEYISVNPNFNGQLVKVISKDDDRIEAEIMQGTLKGTIVVGTALNFKNYYG